MITILLIILVVFLVLAIVGAAPRVGPGNVSEALLCVLLILLILWLAGGLGEGRVL